jgi:hypothetical protein
VPLFKREENETLGCQVALTQSFVFFVLLSSQIQRQSGCIRCSQLNTRILFYYANVCSRHLTVRSKTRSLNIFGSANNPFRILLFSLRLNTFSSVFVSGFQSRFRIVAFFSPRLRSACIWQHTLLARCFLNAMSSPFFPLVSFQPVDRPWISLLSLKLCTLVSFCLIVQL